LSQITQTENTVKKLREQVKPIPPDRSIGRITRMDAIQQKSVAEAMLRNSIQTLDSLNESLKLLNDPAFGICVLCQNPIAVERILAIPQVKSCIRCAR